MRRLLEAARARLRTQIAALLVLAVGVAATLWVRAYVARAIASQAQARFDSLAVAVVDAIRDRFDAYVATLRATRGLFQQRPAPSRSEFAGFVRSSELDRYCPGIQGIGYAQVVGTRDLARHEEAVRAEGFPAYRVWPAGGRDAYAPIVYLEPFDWRNQRAFGFDMLSEPIRREAMLRAADTGEVAATRRVELVQEAGEERQPGFLIYLAVYAREPQGASRVGRASGFVYAPFRAGDLLGSTLRDPRYAPVAVEIFDGDRPDPAQRLYASARRDARGAPEHVARLDVAGRPWTVRVAAAAGFASPWERWLARGVLLGGLLVTAVLFRVTQEEGRSRASAERAARRASFLADAGKALASSLDYRATLAEVAGLAARDIADWCVVLLVEPEGPVRIVGHADAERAREAQARLEGLLLDPEARFGAAAALERGEVFAVRRVDDAALERIARSPAQLRLLRAAGLRSVVTVPLRSRGERLGAISFASCAAARAYEDADVRMAEDLGRLAAAAIDTARLYRRAQDAVRLRDDFLSIASHELKTPLTSLALQSDSLIVAAARGRAPESVGHKAEVIRRNVDRLTRLIANLLDISRIGGGRLDLDLEDLDLRDVVQEVAARFEDEAERAGCALRLELGGAAVGRWDRLRLDQVVTNLVSNAIKYGPGHPVTLTVRASPDRVTLAVRDEGIGIAPEAQERIFERFERAVANRHYGGFGLGLWIVRRIAEALGGEIHVESAPGRGATFTVTLPRRAPAEQSDRAARAGPSPAQPDTR